jgi:hypothetical protein
LRVWVEGELRVTFRRTFDENMFQSWGDLLSVAETLDLKEGNDSLVWCYQNSGVYSMQSLYAIIYYRGVSPVYVPAVWNIVVPPKIHLFLWLLAYNKLATVDNLNKRGMSKPLQCRFCMEEESITHLFFGCVVARNVWTYACEFLGFDIGADFLSVAGKWLNKGKFCVENMISTVVLRGIWLVRNDFVFHQHQQVWSDVKLILRRILKLSWE